jgi:hypothetical protein
MENFVNASLSHLHQVNGLPPPPALLAPIGQTPLHLMPPAILGKSFEVYELPLTVQQLVHNGLQKRIPKKKRKQMQ